METTSISKLKLVSVNFLKGQLIMMKILVIFTKNTITVFVFGVILFVSPISAERDELGLVWSEKYSHLAKPVTMYIKPPLMAAEYPSCSFSIRYDARTGQQTYVNHATKQVFLTSNQEMENFATKMAAEFEKMSSMLQQMLTLFPPDLRQELEDQMSGTLEESETILDEFSKCINPEKFERFRNEFQNSISLDSEDNHAGYEQSNDYETSTGEMITIGKHSCLLNYFSLNGKIIQTACVASFEDYAVREQDVAVVKSQNEYLQRMEKISERMTESFGMEFAQFSEKDKWSLALSVSNLMVILANKDDINDPFTTLIDILYQEVPDTVFDIPTDYKVITGVENITISNPQ